MENCSFILFLWLVMQGVVDNFITLLMNMIYIYEYFAPLSDDSLRIIFQCFIDNYNRLFHFDDILSKILYNLCWLSYMKSATAR
ncbi:hypothetical protein T02_3270 [Trichinella nativa]|uniref:Uncharacterized protein n=1 Tax=Trichinella nativa TaxID=6335 RepID=A0A0V1KVA5_9BILA|nr:hypothetical protein T02_3270 [Trichinella nativa]